jgi:NhaP-type Na+/H+ or K+/H+ antiporter
MADPLNVALAAGGLTVVAVGLFSEQLKKSPVQEPMVALAAGVAIGPAGLALLSPPDGETANAWLEQIARLTLAIGVMGVALRLKPPSPRVLLRPVAVLLTFGMVAMWAISSVLAAWTLGLSLWTAALVGAIVTPTDPVVASSVVTGPFAKRTLPRRLRDAVSFESGANDGLGYLLVTLALAFAVAPAPDGLGGWLRDDLLLGVVMGAALGAGLGLAAAWALNRARRSGLIESESLLSYTVALSLATLGLSHALGGDGVLSVFAAGLAFNLTADRSEEKTEENVQEAVNKLFTLPAFVAIGVLAPFDAWLEAGWPLLGFVALILLLRRALAVGLLWPLLGGPLNGSDRAFMAWFGPVGVAAVYYAAFARAHGAPDAVWTAVSAAVVGSILIHGATSAPGARLYARRPGPVPPRAGALTAISREERRQA